jgi:hypothetical protein
VDRPLWSERVSQASRSGGRIELHVMSLRVGEKRRLWILPLRNSRSFVADGMAGLVEAFKHFPLQGDVVQIH